MCYTTVKKEMGEGLTRKKQDLPNNKTHTNVHGCILQTDLLQIENRKHINLTEKWELNARKRELNARKRDLNARKWDLNARKRDLNARKWDLNARKRDLNARKRDLNSRKRDIDIRKTELNARKRELNTRKRDAKLHDLWLCSTQQMKSNGWP